jgi:hypothetical protein
MRKLARTTMDSWKRKHLREVQGGLCPLCNQPIDLTITGEGVVDHNHDSGEIRGILHRSCNAAEGKVANAIGRWGSKNTTYPAIIAFAVRLVKYWTQPGTGLIYHGHKTPEEKALADKLKARKRAATSRANKKVREAK